MLGLFKKIVGTANERMVNKMRPLVVRINELEDKVAAYSDAKLQAKTVEFKEKIAKGADLDELLPIAFAVACATTTSSSSVASCCTRARSPR
jgi:preprotein translocase subunit SecA